MRCLQSGGEEPELEERDNASEEEADPPEPKIAQETGSAGTSSAKKAKKKRQQRKKAAQDESKINGREGKHEDEDLEELFKAMNIQVVSSTLWLISLRVLSVNFM